MLEKSIDWQGFNKAVIKSIDSDGVVVCDMYKVETDEEGNESIIKRDQNIGFRPNDSKPFELHDGEIEFVQGKNPHDGWLKETIQLWLQEKGIEFSESALKEELLQLVEEYLGG